MKKDISTEEQKILNEKFLRAVTLGDEERVLELLEDGADMNITNVNGDNVLFISADRRKMNVFEILLQYRDEEGNRINLDNKNFLGETAIMHLTKGNNFSTYIENLIVEGANPNIVNNDNISPLIRACGDEKEEIVDILLSSPKIDINYTAPDTLNTAFLMATTHADFSVAEKLYKAGANINAKDKFGNNALLNALFKNNSLFTKKEKAKHLELCMALIELSDVNYVADSGITAFWMASVTRQKEACLSMLEKGVNVDVWHKLGLAEKMSALHIWSKIGDDEMVEKIISAGGKLGVKDGNGNTPEAYAFMRPKLRGLMLEKNIDPNAIYYTKESSVPILSLAISSGDKQIEIVKELIKRGAKVTYEEENKDLLNHEPILTAIASSAKLIVEEILKTNQVDLNRIYKMSDITPGISIVGFLFNGSMHGGLAVHLEQKKYYEGLLKAKEMNDKNDLTGDLISKEDLKKITQELEQLNKLEEDIESYRLNIFEQLLNKGAKLNVENENGLTEVFFATKKEYIELLAKRGADIFHENKDGQDLLYYSIINGNKQVISYLKEEYFKVNHKTIDNLFYQLAFEDVKNYIKQKNIEEGLFTFLDYENNVDLQKVIKGKLEENEVMPVINVPQVHFQDEDGNSPLLVACANNNGYLVSPFLKMGANVNLANNNGETPLMHALATENSSLVRFLIDKGADIHAVNNNGVSVLDMASELKNNAVLRELRTAFENEEKKNSIKP